MGKLSGGWKNSGVVTADGVRPVNPSIVGDANQYGNSDNYRLPGARRNSFTGPDYATTDMRLSRKLYARHGWKVEFTAESFNLLNRLNGRFQITEEGLLSNAAQFRLAPSILESITSLLRTKFLLILCAPPTLCAAAGAVCITSGILRGRRRRKPDKGPIPYSA